MKKSIVLALALMAMTTGYASTAFCYGCAIESRCHTRGSCMGESCVCLKSPGEVFGKCVSLSAVP